MAKVKFTKKNLQNRKELFPADKKSKISKQRSINQGKKRKLGNSSVNRSTKEQSSQSTISTVDRTGATHKDGPAEYGNDETRKVTFTKEQMENWNAMSEERFNDIARIIGTAKQLLAGLKKLRVPHHNPKALTKFKETTTKNLDQLELHESELEFTISKQTDACEKIQEELARIEATRERSQIHPFLHGHFESSLNLPVYKMNGT
uniref:Uncharacterized protein LOC111136078 isoform X2 n=1 Tax=Crassostrea virginica TaxID=6565 RepID=A0A8B8ER07_CRAVI|nr:uncharacterized protein LOC111136078 isoform X2 [Crassostrea virginica]